MPLLAIASFAIVILMVLGSSFATINVYVPNGNTTKNWAGSEGDTSLPAFQPLSGSPWINLGALTTDVNVTSYTTDQSVGSGYYDVFDINVAGLVVVNESNGYQPSMIKLGAYMNQNVNPYNVSNLEVSAQLVSGYSGTGVNITNPTTISIPPVYEAIGEGAATVLDAFLPTYGLPSLAVTAAFYAYNQYAESYDSQFSSAQSVYGTNQFCNTYDVKTQPYGAYQYAALAQLALQWSIPYGEIDAGQSYSLTLFSAAYYPHSGSWNYTYTYLTVASQNGGGGGCVVKGSPILTPNGYVPVQDLKTGDAIEEYNFSSGSLVTGTVFSNNKTEVSQIIKVNNGTLLLTPTDQPVYIMNSTFIGWLRNPENLKPGDSIYNPLNNSWTQVWSVTLDNCHLMVYDLVLTAPNNFIDNGFLLDTKTG